MWRRTLEFMCEPSEPDPTAEMRTVTHPEALDSCASKAGAEVKGLDDRSPANPIHLFAIAP